MQKSILFAFFLLQSLALFSQKTVDVRWGNGTIKSRVMLAGKDTTYVELHHENGQLAYKRWAKDSIVIFAAENEPMIKAFFSRNKPTSFSIEALDKADSTITFRGDGIVISIRKANKDVLESRYIGNVLRGSTFSRQLTTNIFRTEMRDANGVLRNINVVDTSKKNSGVDSTFFKSGRLKIAAQLDTNQGFQELREFDEKGTTVFYYKAEKATTIKVAKDNNECLYGFTNEQNEWVIKPQFDDVKPVGMGQYIACGNGKCTVLDKNGKPVFPAVWDFLEQSSGEKNDAVASYYENEMAQNGDEINEFSIYNYQILALKNNGNFLDNAKFRCRRGDYYGLIDGKGNVVLEAKYRDVRSFNDKFFEVKIGKRWGVVNKKGDVLVQPNYVGVDFTKTPQYFVVHDTFPSYSFYDPTIDLAGLVDAKGTELLPIDFRIAAADTSGKRFIIETKGELGENGYDQVRATMGVFDAEKRAWDLDTLYQKIENEGGSADYLGLNKAALTFKFLKKINVDDKSVVGKGVVDEAGNIALPFEYDNLRLYFDNSRISIRELYSGKDWTGEKQDVYVITERNKMFGLYNLTKKTWTLQPIYENLKSFNLSNDSKIVDFRNGNETEIASLFKAFSFTTLLTAKKTGKWQIIDIKGENMLKESFDYICTRENDGNYGSGIPSICLINNEKTAFISNNSFPLYSTFKEIFDKKTPKLLEFTELENGKIVLNQEAKVLLTPQYKTIFKTPDYIIALDTIQQKQRIIYSDGRIKEFLPQFKILEAKLAKDFVIVENPKTKLLGTVTAEGKPLIPCAFFSIVSTNENDVVWVKQNAPDISLDSVININEYELTALDNAWLMFNRKGKQVNKSTFQYPFLLHKGVGAGMMNGKFGIWRNDGTMLLLPQYDRIFLDTSEQMFYLFKRWADSSLAIGFADMKGKVIKEPRLDKMSPFFGEVAMAFTGGQNALINKKGEYVVPPFMNSFLNFKGSLFDSLNKVNLPIIERMKAIYKKQRENDEVIEPYEPELGALKFLAPFDGRMKKKIDSLSAGRRQILLNFIVEKTGFVDYIPSEVERFQKANAFFHLSSNFENIVYQNVQFSNEINEAAVNESELVNLGYADKQPFFRFENRTLKQFSVGDKYVSIAILGAKDTLKADANVDNPYPQIIEKLTFHNIAKNENGWQNVELTDFLVINRDNSLILNDLLMQKIKQLKNENIDCSNPTVYFEQTKNKFFIKNEGIEFYIPRQNNEMNQADYDGFGHANLLLTWAELKPFLVKKR